ncbi:MAG: hypothetical protein A3C93_02725 [Candidatus Lloydbacteria bacterium RIFCSPHIGHO2_02_FULL_54_17]|uniref:Aspartyl/glutamyl-tRNA(Asn/Gln) amidotransferase subunit C n=1 Tax=Candidatus Lloydbacteria bacterium RIFCSPHIGHO2_02_FULL_54_17 TaxID=1798664 RepID=A0A1G2DBF2_9BACT|nr:MAG: hypothetical protein A2762_05975 [Candidatus Lloydbacteria bacterium RIFCSPHIGHO2_01_FULL_54_11]OGZ10954.1 MAG: hypothetical protein A3C93_02725 [Candidatus Lloydbacteria bacterium RIFCSPHIGHO2_02_FULL_54_17]OGZ14934.1 MAG: hypothetical protein A2948_05320 [Candidatus Lloydbacteria bacterium RIFCSPLOWO2_01_FULL_54_18]OGZ15874.1 MAG: hypothetical protein A3H76_06840 [Candidatus Lloydbacteria bacterium RIFCSPLOWO2_02_FULL_54_12]
MLRKEDIEHLGTLARIGLSEQEKTELLAGVEAVLGYVSNVSGVVTDAESAPVAGSLRNVLREDGEAYPGGAWSEAILANAPRREDDFFKVGQIL